MRKEVLNAIFSIENLFVATETGQVTAQGISFQIATMLLLLLFFKYQEAT